MPHMEATPAYPSAPPEAETFPLHRIQEIVQNFETWISDRRDEMAMTAAIYDTRFWDYYAGFGKRKKLFNEWKFNGTEIEVNRLRKMVRTYQGALYPRASRVVCEPDPHGRGDPQSTQAALNAWWKKPYAYVTVDDTIQMGLMLPGAGFKVGYDIGTKSPIERTWIRPIPPWELILDRDAPSWEDERYRGHLYQAPLTEVLRRYPELRGKGLVGSQRRDFFDNANDNSPTLPKGMSGETPSVGQFVKVLEFNNLRDDYESESGERYRGRLEVYILDQRAEISNTPVYCGPLPFEDADGTPLPNIEPLVFDHEVGYPFRPLAPTKAAIPQQIELNLMRTAMAQDVRRNTRKYLYRKGALGQDELDKLNNGVDLQGAAVEEGVPMNEAFLPIQAPPVSADTQRYMGEADRDLDRQLGPSQNAQGQKIDTTAYEVQTIQLYAEEEIRYHALMLNGTLARVTKLAQCAFRLAGMHSGDSEGGSTEVPGSGGVAGAEGVADGQPVPAAPKSFTRRPTMQAFQPFAIMDGEQKLEVTDESLAGDFPITFVDADTTPVNRQTVLQFMTGPGLVQYQGLWQVVEKGGAAGMLAERAMQHLAEAMNLPKDMHPAAMLADLRKQKAKEAAAPKKGRPSATQPPPEPKQAPAGDGTAKLVQVLQGAAQQLSGLVAEVPEVADAGEALMVAIEAAEAGDVAGLAEAVGVALQALPEGVAPEVAALLGQLAGKLGASAPSAGQDQEPSAESQPEA